MERRFSVELIAGIFTDQSNVTDTKDLADFIWNDAMTPDLMMLRPAIKKYLLEMDPKLEGMKYNSHLDYDAWILSLIAEFGETIAVCQFGEALSNIQKNNEKEFSSNAFVSLLTGIHLNCFNEALELAKHISGNPELSLDELLNGNELEEVREYIKNRFPKLSNVSYPRYYITDFAAWLRTSPTAYGEKMSISPMKNKNHIMKTAITEDNLPF